MWQLLYYDFYGGLVGNQTDASDCYGEPPRLWRVNLWQSTKHALKLTSEIFLTRTVCKYQVKSENFSPDPPVKYFSPKPFVIL